MIRKLSLEEWFLNYQLAHIEKKYAHLNAFIDVDISKIVDHFKGRDIPLTTIFVKACSLWQLKEPQINRQVFKTLFGYQMYICEKKSVNLPVAFNVDNKPYVSVMCIESAYEKSLNEIKTEIKEYLKKDPKTFFMGRKLIGKKNSVLNRLRLKLIHFIVNNFPKIQQKHNVGNISVSSLLSLNHQGCDVVFCAKGPGAMSLTLSSVDFEKKRMKVGVAWDHGTGHGVEGVNSSYGLCRILQGENDNDFSELIREE